MLPACCHLVPEHSYRFKNKLQMSSSKAGKSQGFPKWKGYYCSMTSRCRVILALQTLKLLIQLLQVCFLIPGAQPVWTFYLRLISLHKSGANNKLNHYLHSMSVLCGIYSKQNLVLMTKERGNYSSHGNILLNTWPKLGHKTVAHIIDLLREGGHDDLIVATWGCFSPSSYEGRERRGDT